MDFGHYLRTHEDPAGATPVERYRSAVVMSEVYSGEVIGIPVVVVSRAPAPLDPAAWLCVRQTIGHDRHWLASVPADRVLVR